jgi:hypothetical protein
VDLKRVPNGIAVLGVLRTGVVTTLATTKTIAQSIISLEDATRRPHWRTSQTSLPLPGFSVVRISPHRG